MGADDRKVIKMTTKTGHDLQLPEGALRLEPITDEQIIALEAEGESEYLSAVWVPKSGRYAELMAAGGEGYLGAMPIKDLLSEMVHKEDADLPLVKARAARLVFSYPMGKPSFVRMVARDGQAITWSEAITMLAEGYGQIYGIEERALEAAAASGEASARPFEIFAHALSGLALTGFTIVNADGKIWIMPEIES